MSYQVFSLFFEVTYSPNSVSSLSSRPIFARSLHLQKSFPRCSLPRGGTRQQHPFSLASRHFTISSASVRRVNFWKIMGKELHGKYSKRKKKCSILNVQLYFFGHAFMPDYSSHLPISHVLTNSNFQKLASTINCTSSWWPFLLVIRFCSSYMLFIYEKTVTKS